MICHSAFWETSAAPSLAGRGAFKTRLQGVFVIGCRKCVHKWLVRFAEGGAKALVDGSRAPHSTPQRTEEALERLIISERRPHPIWGKVHVGGFRWRTPPGSRLRRGEEDVRPQGGSLGRNPMGFVIEPGSGLMRGSLESARCRGTPGLHDASLAACG